MSDNRGGEWSRQMKIPEADSLVGPALAYIGRRLYVAWKGQGSDCNLYCSFSADHGDWFPRQIIPAARSRHAPALAAFNDKLWAAWRDESGDTLKFASMTLTHVAGPQAIIPDTGTSDSPALMQVGHGLHDSLCAAWRGVDADTSLYVAVMQKKGVWDTPAALAGGVSAAGPALACYGYGDGEVLYASWRGAGGDESLYFASLKRGKDERWSHFVRLTDRGSSLEPALVQFEDKLYAAWKGAGSDSGIYLSSMDKSEKWSSQQKIPGVGTSHRPSLAVLDKKLYACWKGSGTDPRLYYQVVAESSP